MSDKLLAGETTMNVSSRKSAEREARKQVHMALAEGMHLGTVKRVAHERGELVHPRWRKRFVEAFVHNGRAKFNAG